MENIFRKSHGFYLMVRQKVNYKIIAKSHGEFNYCLVAKFLIDTHGNKIYIRLKENNHG